MSSDDRFEIASGADLQKRYGLTAENRPTIRLESSLVPEPFRRWIPLAEQWGIGDDLIREDCVMEATTQELQDLLKFDYENVLDAWLAGPEAKSPNPTNEYIAFSCLGMAWDYAAVILEKRKT